MHKLNLALALGLMACAAAAQQPIKHSLGTISIAGACPNVAPSGQQSRALSWKEARVSVEARFASKQKLNDHKSLREVRSCSAEMIKKIPGDRLGQISTETERTVTEEMNNCLAAAQSGVRIASTILRHSAVQCQ